MSLERRDLLKAVPAMGLAGLLAGSEAGGSPPGSATHFRVDDPATIMSAARQMISDDWVGVLVTVDEHGMPRARPIGVSDPTDDWSLWMSTRRGSRKTRQIMANPKAALHFGFDDVQNGTKNSYYASFTGTAWVHVDHATIARHGPPPEYRSQWPSYPDDLALIRFRPATLEVMGKGIKPDAAFWQPQGVSFDPR